MVVGWVVLSLGATGAVAQGQSTVGSEISRSAEPAAASSATQSVIAQAEPEPALRFPLPQSPGTPEPLPEGTIETPSTQPNPVETPVESDDAPDAESGEGSEATESPAPAEDTVPGTPGPADTAPPPDAETAPTPTTPPAAEQPPEPQVLVSEVVVEGAEGDLQTTVYSAISTRPGRTTTRSQLQQDINAIFATGFFSNVRAEPSDTPLGVRVTFLVEPNPVLRSVQVAGNQVLTQETVDEIFGDQYGQILNLRELQSGIEAINKFYQDSGYVLGQVVGTPQVDVDGTVTLQVAEGVVEDIGVRYLNKENEPTKGKTREFIITRELRLQPGDVLNRDALQRDLRRVFDLGLFEDVQVSLEPGEDPRKVIVTLNVKERNTGSFSAGAGFSSASGLFGTASYTESNFGGNNQDLSAQIQLGTRELLFDIGFTDPWIATDPYRTSYSVNVFNRLTRPYVFEGGPIEVDLPNGDSPRINRLGTSINFTRPLTLNPDKIPRALTASVGLQYQLVSARDGDFRVTPRDALGNPLTFSPSGQDDLLTLQVGLARDLRNDPIAPTSGSLWRVGLEQSVPVGSGNILLNRIRGSYSYFVPVNLLRFSSGAQALAFNVQAGTVFGDLPPYEAFTLGGSNSIRGYGEGDLGSGRSFVQATAEYRFPLFNIIGGALFFDIGSTLGTQDAVLGAPGIVRGKPGFGFGYGAGVRVRTPLGNVRIDYGINDDGDNRFHFGIGERF